MQSFRTHAIPLLAITSAVAVLVSACGGGGGPQASTTAAVQTGTVALSGSAATGFALGNATVDIKCAAGSGGTTTTAEGSYSVTLSNAALPCVLKVTSADNTTTYHSVAAGSGGGNVVANVTPLTELVVARATGMTPAQFFTSFTSAQSQVIAASSLQAAVAAVAQALNSALALGEVNPLTSTLVPATPSNPNGGNAHDQLLDQLQAAITNAGTSLAGLTQIVAAPPGSGGSSLGAALESSLAASVADGFFDFLEEDNVWVLSRAFASGAPVNGTYNMQFRGYTQSGNQWQTRVRDTTQDERYLSSNGWISSGSLTDGTLRQTGQNNFQFQQGGGALVENLVIQTTRPATVNLGMVDPSLSGNVTLPSGAQVFNFSITIGQDLYELNGGTGFGGTTTLDQLRSNYGNTGNYLTWMSGGTPDQLGWRFGPNGTLLLYTGVAPNCNLPSCPVPVSASSNGTWTVVTRNGVQIMELNIPAAAGNVGLNTGEKIIYSVIPGGNVQEGIFSPAGAPAGDWTSYSRTAMNAILAAAGRPAVPAN